MTVDTNEALELAGRFRKLAETMRKHKAACVEAYELDAAAEMLRVIANELISFEERIIVCALEEYNLDHFLEGPEELAGRNAAIRGMMVRLGLYSKFTNRT